MDLSRAKVVLIVTFFVLNLFLLYQIVMNEGMDNPVLFAPREEVSRLEKALQEANLSLDIPLPRGGVSVAYLVVMPWQPVEEDVVGMLWQGLGNETENAIFSSNDLLVNDDSENNISSWRFGPYELFLYKEGPIQLHNAFKDLEPENKEIAVEEFMNRVSFLQDFVYDYKVVKHDKTVIYYHQEFEAFPLYAGYVEFNCAGEYEPGCEIYLYRLEPLGFGEQKREVIPPSTALWRFLDAYTESEYSDYSTVIVEFSLGYYSEEYDAQRWEIPPVWRIRLLNGEIFYINAFTGYLEN